MVNRCQAEEQRNHHVDPQTEQLGRAVLPAARGVGQKGTDNRERRGASQGQDQDHLCGKENRRDQVEPTQTGQLHSFPGPI